jgi:protein transport protein SEC61 subunit gamma-like protein
MKFFDKKEGSENKRSLMAEMGISIPKPKQIPILAKNKIKEYARVLRITKKPSTEEYKSIVKASALGMVVIGLIGFVIHMAVQASTMYR